MALVLQDPSRNLLAYATVRQNVAPAADYLVEYLSGGQQQRVAVVQALGTDANVFLADEPTAELAADDRELVGLLIERARRGAVVVIASHDPDVVAACDDVLDL